MRSLRWIVLLAASLLLHAVFLNWAHGSLGFPSLHEKPQTIMTTALLAPPVKPVTQPAPAPSKPKTRPQPPLVPVTEPATDDTVAAPPKPDSDIPDSRVEPVGEAVTTENSETTGTQQPPPPRYKVSPPPSAELKYEVQSLRDGQKWHGAGTFRWENNGGNYSVTGEASITLLLKVAVLNFKSEGIINEFGIAPELYTEKPWRKSMTNTHFHHANKSISFSASTATYPYQGGEQDRASIMWHLASIGRGDASQFAPGTELDIVVAGARDAETWRIKVAGLEEIDTAHGTMVTWHVVREPRAGSYDQKIDIWLAPEREWYPVKVRYTYANGDHLDMSLSNLTPVASRSFTH